ncbi:two-component sensor histidine kinase [Streptomyces spiroverticillatus]|uniref:Two-component sensor histidine kinase n=1 Tax=Streptomyces finlayi TaxID=67296 RepID=A0A919C788_9ACTN|nr:sensor histidine kinase [Streptomyces finlayi]GGZ85960.1 two-component sensor histidine kinase [Streptomyces spiroverticillatus]GHC77494.1 two-component sensor histidine kinase [Streptomyces finlayi]
MRSAPIGQRPRNIPTKVVAIAVWLVFLGDPLGDLLSAAHQPLVTALGALGLLAFVAVYVTLFAKLVFGQGFRTLPPRIAWAALGAQFALACLLSLTLGDRWLALFVYVAVSAGATLPVRQARWSIPGVTLVLVLIGVARSDWHELKAVALLPLMIGGAMVGVRQLVRTTQELREARATVAQLAANEERLRLARDLHDLLGHSLSLITLKSELAGKMLPGHPEQAAQQVADIEKVSRQALVDVREAVTGYRRATLSAELAGARTALAAAGIESDVPVETPGELADVPPEQEEALAWALREAVTNVVRHSGARHCTVRLCRSQTLDGAFLELTVTDDGRGAEGPQRRGNGLTGMGERLAEVGGTAAPDPTGPGFTLRARVPLPADGT